jgi:hypothetical protein
MSDYKKNADANKDSLVGGTAAKGPKHKKLAASNRDALFGSAANAGDKKKPSATPQPRQPAPLKTASEPSRGYKPKSLDAKKPKKPVLQGEAAKAKIQEAEEYKEKANKAMQKSFFASPDPVAASTYYKRAADAYQAVGDYRLERFYRLSSGQCNMQVRAWASAAQDYTRAAELVLQEQSDEPDADGTSNNQESYNYHKKAAEAWMQMGEKSKAAKSHVLAAIALSYNQQGTLLSKEALQGMEEAIEAHVPDLLNPFARYRQTGVSAFIDPDSDETVENPTPESLQMAKEQIVTRSYSHEPLIELVNMLVSFGEYASALYAAGAAAAILQNDNISTLTLSRVYVVETILQLSMGDPIAAEQTFLNRHCQQTAYLSSRECALAEDLFRAVKNRDADALEETRRPSGSHRAALANLDPPVRELVTQIRLSGVARKIVGDTTGGGSSRQEKPKTKKVAKDDAAAVDDQPAKSLNDLIHMKTGYEKDVVEGEALDAGALDDELDALNFGDDEGGEEDLDDDELDLR